MPEPLNIYIGYDSREDAAYQVCRQSILEYATVPVSIVPLRQDWLRRVSLYRRQFFVEDGQSYDTQDGRPFSTEFSFTRFLVPALQPEGWAIFCDSDFLFRDDVANLAALHNPAHAVMCVKHDYQPDDQTKMRGQAQQRYARKNWSSLMLWNCSHPSARMLTPYMVNRMPGAWLHGLTWLPDNEIGGLPADWNWLDGHSDPDANPSAVHFTRGTPDMPGWESTQYAPEWIATWKRLD